MNKQENDNSTVIADLPIDEAQQNGVKGGEERDVLGKTYYVGTTNGGVWK